jgi:hypothetical protein
VHVVFYIVNKFVNEFLLELELGFVYVCLIGIVLYFVCINFYAKFCLLGNSGIRNNQSQYL